MAGSCAGTSRVLRVLAENPHTRISALCVGGLLQRMRFHAHEKMNRTVGIFRRGWSCRFKIWINRLDYIRKERVEQGKEQRISIYSKTVEYS